MIQSARTGKQNILEGSKASPTSKEMEIKLTNVARASLEELLATTATTFAFAICNRAMVITSNRLATGAVTPARPAGRL
jgi:hypothetical protein